MKAKEKPLAGRKILVTRSEKQAIPLVKSIESKGGEAVVIPLLTFRLPNDLSRVMKTIHEIHSYQWIVFTSQNTVQYFFKLINQEDIPLETLQTMKLAAIGKKTKQCLEEYGLRVDFHPTEFVAELFAHQFANVVRKEEAILLPQGNRARSTIQDKLIEQGKSVKTIVVYETLPDMKQREALIQTIEKGQLDILTFTSSSSVHFFFALLGETILRNRPKIVCIGPVTARTVEAYGYRADTVARVYTVDGLLEAIELDLDEEETNK